jgi:hypothetical protein
VAPDPRWRLKRPWWVRLITSIGAGLALGVLVAIALTVVDLYLAGHGRRPLGAPLLDVTPLGIHLSLADVLFLSAVVFGAAITWRRTAGGGAQ